MKPFLKESQKFDLQFATSHFSNHIKWEEIQVKLN